jgi:hypothetical protein
MVASVAADRRARDAAPTVVHETTGGQRPFKAGPERAEESPARSFVCRRGDESVTR